MLEPVLVVHTTESDPGTAQAVASYLRNAGSESHTVYDPTTDEEVVLLDWSTSARALKNLTGGVETNRRGRVYQVEIVGRAVNSPDQPTSWYDNLRRYLRRACDETGTPFVFPCQFVAYPASYGRDNGVRLSFEEWLTVTGVLGHAHVPENVHGDPGDISRVISSPLSAAELEQALAALEIETPIAYHDEGTGVAAQAAFVNAAGWTLDAAVEAKKAAISASNSAAAALAAIKALPAPSASTGAIDLDVLANKVADVLAKRLGA